MKSFSCVTALLASIVLFSAPSARAQQLSIYGSAALTDFGFDRNGTNAVKSDTGGFVAGVFYNFPIQSRVTAGIDARISDGFGPRGGTTVGVALRVGFVPNVVRVRPYFQLGGGFVTSTIASGQITGPVGQGLTLQPTRFTTEPRRSL